MSFENIGDRNNTSFISKLNESLKSITKDKADFLKYHQRIVTEYVLRYPRIRGILIYMAMGSGKTLLGVSLCETLLNTKKYNRVIFISPKSLHENFKKDFIKYTKINPDIADKFNNDSIVDSHLKDNYNFVSLNASNMFKQVERVISDVEEKTLNINKQHKLILNEDVKENEKIDVSLDDSIIIFDEFHNFLNSLSNGSSNAVQLYDLIMKSKNTKTICMTGTPITNTPYEITLGFNMIAGQLPDGHTLFGESFDEFNRNFINNHENLDMESINNKRPTIKHKDKFQDRILGLVSYYGADTPEFKLLYPVEFELIVKKIPMSQKQFSAYIEARDKEIEENKRGLFKEQPSRIKKPSGVSSSYRVRSRQFSNVLYPDYAAKKWKDEKGYTHYERYIDKLEPAFFEKDELIKYSPKIVDIITTCASHLPDNMLSKFKLSKKQLDSICTDRTKINEKQLKELGNKKYHFGIGPGLVYSQFLDSGVHVLARALVHHGMEDITLADLSNISPGISGRIAIISGDVPAEQRAALIKVFNMAENMDGSMLSLLLVTATGAEGISLDRGRHVHIMEPYWHWARIKQVITRIIRLNSHITLEKAERNVQAYMYLSVYPSKTTDSNNNVQINKIMTTENTTDTTLFVKALENQFLINDFLKAIQEASIDCISHYNKDCRICAPTNKQLWYMDINTDIKEISPCEPFTKQVIKTKQIKIGDKIYNYTDKDGINIYKYDDNIGSYTEMLENDPLYVEIYEKIMK